MSNLSIQMTDASASYQPGDRITGSVSWTGLDRSVEQIEINLLWHTQGKGDRDHETFARDTVDRPPTTGSREFDFVAPAFPSSFSGKLISVVWSIEVILLPGLDCQTHELVISPDGTERKLDSVKSAYVPGQQS